MSVSIVRPAALLLLALLRFLTRLRLRLWNIEVSVSPDKC